MTTETRVFEIWAEGFCDQGSEGRWTRPFFHGSQTGIDFMDACRKFADQNAEFAKCFYVQNGEPYSYTKLHPHRPRDRS